LLGQRTTGGGGGGVGAGETGGGQKESSKKKTPILKPGARLKKTKGEGTPSGRQGGKTRRVHLIGTGEVDGPREG